MRRLILLLLLPILVAGCGGGGSLEAPSGAVMTLTPASKDAPIKITSTSTIQKSVVQLYQLAVKDSSLAGAKGVRDTIFDVTFELSNIPGTATADLASLVTLCDGAPLINTTAERQTDDQGIYNLCVVFKVGGGLNYTGNLRVLSGAANASTTIEITSTPADLALSPDLTIPPGSRGQFTITGGSPEYTITSSSLSILPVPAVVTASGGAFMVTVPLGTTESPIFFTVRDSAGKTARATVTVGVPAAPTVLPSAATVIAGGTVKFMIVGGVPNYTVTSSVASIAPNPETVTANGGTFTVTVPANTTATTVTMNVRDSVGGSKDVTLTIQAPTKPAIVPSSLTMTAGNTATFAISGGVPGYTVVSSHSAVSPIPSRVADSGDTFLVFTSSSMPTTAGITLTVIDAIGQTTAASVSITALSPQLAITPTAITVVPSTQQNLNFTISGGTAPYVINSSNPTDVYFGTAGVGTTTGASVTATVRAGASAGTVTLRVTDSVNAQRTATITILAVPQIQIVPNAVAVLSAAPDDTIPFTISGGVAPYTVTSSSPANAYLGTLAGTGVITITNAPLSFTATVPAGAAVGPVTVTVQDSLGNPKTATITVQ